MKTATNNFKINSQTKMKRLIILFLAITFMPFMANSQNMMEMPVPLDETVRTGKLENGLTYYIKHNEEPKERASFYIIQNVGALLEDDNQNGLAHFLEHMAFNGTEHFEGKGIINTLEKHGVAFGRNINAYTSFGETVYNMSDVPVLHEGLVDTCLLVLHDWSNYLLLTDEEIDAERGVISEEWRTRRNAGFRMRATYFPVLFKGSKYAERDVIGDLDIIKNFEYETLRKFYHDWYRSDLQAIAVVGDIDVDEVEGKVKELFAKIPAVEDAQERPDFKIPEHEETLFVVATDKEAPQSSISIYIKHEGTKAEDKNLGYLRGQYTHNLFNTMVRERISELLQKGTPPFVVGGISFSGFIGGYDALSISATANPNQEDVALKAIYTEAQRIVQHGFHASELGRAKTNLLTSMESAYKQRDKISNDRYVRGFQQHYLSGEPYTSAEFDWQFGQKILETIEVEEINAKVKDWIVPANRVIIVMGPEGEDVIHLTEDEALSIISEVEDSTIDPYEDSAEVTSLISEELTGSKVISEKKLEDLDAIEWKLANNATIIYRHADYEKDNVTIRAISPGGSSIFEADAMSSAMMLPQFIGAFGVGEFDAVALKKVLTGKKASVNVALGDLNESVVGSSTPKDFETMMQLLYLQFEQPRFDTEAYGALQSRYVAYLANMANNPQKIMGDSLSLILTDYNERTKLVTPELFNDISVEKIEQLYTDRFQDAGDFTFIIVGNIEAEVAKTMAEKYIGSLSDNPREETWIDRKVSGPEGKTVKEIEIPLETKKANVVININKEMPYSPAENLKLSVLQAILRLRYTEEIREKEGGTYGVRVSASSSHFPVAEKTLQMQFDTDPEKANHLKNLLIVEIDKIIENGPTEEDLDKVVKNMLKEREQAKEHNNYWMGTLSTYLLHGYNRDADENFASVLNSMSTADVQKFTSELMTGNNLVDIIFKPKPE